MQATYTQFVRIICTLYIIRVELCTAIYGLENFAYTGIQQQQQGTDGARMHFVFGVSFSILLFFSLSRSRILRQIANIPESNETNMHRLSSHASYCCCHQPTNRKCNCKVPCLITDVVGVNSVTTVCWICFNTTLCRIFLLL